MCLSVFLYNKMHGNRNVYLSFIDPERGRFGEIFPEVMILVSAMQLVCPFNAVNCAVFLTNCITET